MTECGNDQVGVKIKSGVVPPLPACYGRLAQVGVFGTGGCVLARGVSFIHTVKCCVHVSNSQ